MGRDHESHNTKGESNVPGVMHTEGEGEHKLKEHGGELKKEHHAHPKENTKEHAGHGNEHGHGKGHGEGHGKHEEGHGKGHKH